jgi:hypothetical protein
MGEVSPNWRSRPGAYEMGFSRKAGTTTNAFNNNMLRINIQNLSFTNLIWDFPFGLLFTTGVDSFL